MPIKNKIKMTDATIKLASAPHSVIKVTVSEIDDHGIWVIGEGIPTLPNEHDKALVFIPYAQLAWMAVHKDLANAK